MNDQKPSINGTRILAALGLAAVFLGLFAAVYYYTPEGSALGNSTDCREAQEYHYAEALKGGSGAEGHFYAALAAAELERLNQPCVWEAP